MGGRAEQCKHSVLGKGRKARGRWRQYGRGSRVEPREGGARGGGCPGGRGRRSSQGGRLTVEGSSKLRPSAVWMGGCVGGGLQAQLTRPAPLPFSLYPWGAQTLTCQPSASVGPLGPPTPLVPLRPMSPRLPRGRGQQGDGRWEWPPGFLLGRLVRKCRPSRC